MGKRFLGAIVVALAIACMTGGVAHAAGLSAGQARAVNSTAGLTPLSIGYTYGAYDITGDNKADTIQLKWLGKAKSGTRTYRAGLVVTVNGSTALKLGKGKINENGGRNDVKIVSLADGTKFLWVSGVTVNSCDLSDALYAFKDGKLSKAYDLHKVLDKKAKGSYVSYGLRSPDVARVANNAIVLNCFTTQSMVGCASFHPTLVHRGGKLVLSPRDVALSVTYGNGKSALKAKRSIAVYTSQTGSKRAFTIKKGQQATFSQICMKNRAARIHVTVGGKSGWMKYDRAIMKVKASKDGTVMSNKYFKHIVAVG